MNPNTKEWKKSVIESMESFLKELKDPSETFDECILYELKKTFEKHNKIFEEWKHTAYLHTNNKKLKDVDCHDLFEMTTDYINEEYQGNQEILEEYGIKLKAEEVKSIMSFICYDLLSRLVNIGVDEENIVMERTWVPE